MPRAEQHVPTHEAGFTLTELLVGLLVASMLVLGLIELTRRYARTSDEVRDTMAIVRASHAAQSVLALLERADPGTVVVSPDRLSARQGNRTLEAAVSATPDGAQLIWRSPGLDRKITLPPGARFEKISDGLILLVEPGSPVPVAIATPRRELPYDCQFDSLTLRCHP